MKKSIIFCLVSCFVVLGFATNTKAQAIQENQVFLSGIVTDINSGVPLKCDIKITNGDKKTSIFSDSLTGKYNQLVKAGINYTFTFYTWNIYRTKKQVSFPTNAQYREESMDFQVLLLKPGVVVENYNFFEGNSTTLSDDAKAKLKKFKTQMRFHRKTKWKLYISAKDAGGSKEIANKRLIEIKNHVETTYKAYAKKVTVELLTDGSLVKNDTDDFIIVVDTITKSK